MGLSLGPASIPFWGLTCGLTAILLYTILARGETIVRIAVVVATVCTMPWSVGNALLLSTDDPRLVVELGRFAAGPLSAIGPAVLFLFLVISGMLERYRYLVLIFAVVGGVSCITAWSTELVVDEVWRSAWGILLPSSGPLSLFHRSILVLSLVAALAIALRRRSRERPGMPARQIAVVTALASLAALEGILLSYQIGVYPFSVVFASGAVVVVIRNLQQRRLVRSRGLDRATLYELALLTAMIPLLVVVTGAAIRSGNPAVVAVILIVPLFAASQITATLIRDHLAAKIRQRNRVVDVRLEEFGEYSTQVRDEVELADALRDLLDETSELSRIALFVDDERGRLRRAGREGPDAFALDATLYRWLVDHPDPMILTELSTLRLGRAHESVESLFETTAADVLLPLVDREELVGLISACSPERRAPDEDEVQLLAFAARFAAKALTYLRLVREAEDRIEIANELKVAVAVQYAHYPGERERTYETCQVIEHYLPATQFGGDWWMTRELPDGRVLVVIGDVAGRGMPAALVSSSVQGACYTAQSMLGASCEVLSLLALLNQSVRAVGGESYPMSCFAAVIDLEDGIASFANAGHPFPYLCRRKQGEPLAELVPLISRGTRLGTEQPLFGAATVDVQDGDVLVFYSDALVNARNSEGQPYGDRRLQQVLQRFVHPAGERACAVIVEDALAYCDQSPIGDDLTVIVLRMRMPPRRY